MVSFYGRYFSVDPAFGGKGYGSLLKREAVNYLESSTKGPHLFYAYIEETNERSMRIFRRDNYTSIGTFEPLVFSRLYPRADPRAARLAKNDLDGMLARLHTAYQTYTLVQFNKVYDDQNYFVWKEKGEVIAGVQVNPVQWRMVDMPGLTGKLIMHLLPHVPVVKRLFNPYKYQFAAFEALYVQQGREDALLKLLESTLAYFELTSGLVMLDVNSPMYHQLKETRKLGVMNALKKSTPTHVMAKWREVEEGQGRLFDQRPIYVSAFDCT